MINKKERKIGGVWGGTLICRHGFRSAWMQAMSLLPISRVQKVCPHCVPYDWATPPPATRNHIQLNKPPSRASCGALIQIPGPRQNRGEERRGEASQQFLFGLLHGHSHGSPCAITTTAAVGAATAHFSPSPQP